MFQYWMTEFAVLNSEDPSYSRFNGLPDFARPIKSIYICQRCGTKVFCELENFDVNKPIVPKI